VPKMKTKEGRVEAFSQKQRMGFKRGQSPPSSYSDEGNPASVNVNCAAKPACMKRTSAA